jgi:P4 family phage/plasmid primase-like protien
MGWAVLHLEWGEKFPGRKNWQNERHEDEQSVIAAFSDGLHNIGMLLGPVSDNTVDCDQDHPLWAEVVDDYLRATGKRFGRPSKPNGHRLYRCEQLPNSEKFVDPIPAAEGGMGTIGEIRAKATQYTVLPGSLHKESGEMVVWFEDGERAEVNGDELRRAYAQGCAETLLYHHWPGEGARHDPALALAGGLLRAEWDEGEVKRLLEFLWPSADPGQIDGVIRLTSEKLGKEDQKVTGWRRLEEHVNPAVVRTVKQWLGIGAASNRPPLTDFGNAERFVARYGRDVRYCSPWGKWLVWDGRRWQTDDRGVVREWGKDTIRAIAAEAVDEADGEQRKETLKWAFRCEMGRSLDTMLQFAQSMSGVALLPEDLDRNPWLLNVANGTIDLQKLELRESRREDLLTKAAPVAYLPNAACPTWESFIRTAMEGKHGETEVEQSEMVGYLRRLVGYILCGDITEKMLPLLYGPGDTGKTTFTELVLELMGNDYGKTTTEDTIAAKKGNYGSIPNDVAALRGARLVVVSETSRGLQLNEGRIKAMTGRNQIPARFLNQEWFTFIPEFTLLIETNHRPQITDTDSAIWNRVKPIPFLNVIPKEEQDGRLPDRLRAEMPGILNWALAGFAEWRSGGLREPDTVRGANEDYRNQSDRLRDFLNEQCEIGDGQRIRSGELYRAYKGFIEGRGLRPLGDQEFSETMRERGFVKKDVKGYGTWLGIGLKPSASTDDLMPKAFGGNRGSAG